MRANAKPYSGSAAVYNHMMRQVNYKKWAEYIFAITSPHLPKNPKILDASAGTGILLRYLSQRFPDITASDLSAEMAAAIQYAGSGVACADMAALPFRQCFHMVISSFDSVNYLLTQKKLLAFFRSAASVLAAGGLLCFDVSLIKNSTGSLRHLNRGGTVNGIVYNRRSAFNERTCIHTNRLIITFPNGAVKTEIHKQKIYPLDVYFDLMEKAGFYVIECLEGFEYGTVHAGSPRAQFVARSRR